MKFEPGNIYHVYNQGNNHEKLFLSRAYFEHFINLYKGYVLPSCETIAWCLMPNHFHFMLYTDDRCSAFKQQGNLSLDPVTNGFRKLLSTYAHQFNKQNNRSGALFRPKTKSKCLIQENEISGAAFSDYFFTCLNYIHNNPVKSNLVSNASDWEWSSFNFYAGKKKDCFCNNQLLITLGLDMSRNK